MDEDERVRNQTPEDRVGEEAATPVPTPKRTSRKKWPLLILGAIVGVPALVIAAWMVIALNWSYSEGDRAGFIQKFSHKGWVCKTWEGDLAQVSMPGAAPEHFLFTVRDDSIAKEITKLSGKQVSLTYKEHPGVPGTCFGETDYFVTGVRALP